MASTKRAAYSTTRSSPVRTISSVGSGSTESTRGADLGAALPVPVSDLWRVGVVDPDDGARGPA
jgi:hypothetical protein